MSELAESKEVIAITLIHRFLMSFRRSSAAVVATCVMVLSLAVPAIRVIQSQVTPRVRIDPIPMLDVGGDGAAGGPLLMRAENAVRLDDRIVVYDAASESLLFFDLRGRLIRKIAGSESTEPGAFSTLIWVGRCARGSLFLVDPRRKRITVLDPAGNYLRQFRPPPFAIRWSCSEKAMIAALMMPVLKPYRIWTRERGFAPIQFLDADGNFTDVVPHVAVGDGLFGGVHTSIAMSNDRLYVGTGDSASVDVYDLSARRSGSVSVGGVKPRLMTRTEYEAIVVQQLGHQWADSVVKLVLQAPMPKYHPLYRDLRAAPDGTLWLVVSARSDQSTTLRVFSPQGNALGEVHFPRPTNVLEVGANYLIAEYKTPSGVEHVAMYRVHFGR